MGHKKLRKHLGKVLNSLHQAREYLEKAESCYIRVPATSKENWYEKLLKVDGQIVKITADLEDQEYRLRTVKELK